MSEQHNMKVIARIHNDFPTKFGIPHQSNRLSALKATIVFEPEYRVAEAFRGRLQLYLAYLAVFGSSERKLVSDSKAAEAWGKYANGSICDQISVSSESSGTVIRLS